MAPALARRQAVVAQRGALVLDPGEECLSDGFVEARNHVGVERPGLAQRVDLRLPQGLVGIDVAHAGHGPLVEQCCLDRRPPPAQAICERLGREAWAERLLAETRGEVRLELSGLEHEPRAEPSHVAVGNVRSIV